jgi:hypothetical protein
MVNQSGVSSTKKGHWAKDCWSTPKKGKAHLAQTEEEEPSLFLVSAAVPIPAELQSGGADDLLANSGVDGLPRSDSMELSLGVTLEPIFTQVDLKEERVFAHIGERGDNDHC